MTQPPKRSRDAALKIVQVLRDAGFTAYLAGGCVRDTLLGQTPKDFDVATDARPDQVHELFRRSRYVGEAFGVVLVTLFKHATEVATFRKEWGYTDGRHPGEVAFTDAADDASRRDFTVNGLFADPSSGPPPKGCQSVDHPELGTVIDYVGGLADLEAKQLRAIGDAGERFGEDYLRMLRAVRFAARLNFAIESRTANAIRPLAKYLGQISRERIGGELQLMLLGPTPALAAALTQEHGLDVPVLNEDHQDAPLPTLTSLSAAGQEGSPPGSHDTMPALARDEVYPALLAAWMLDRHAAAAWQDAAPSWARLHQAAAFATRQSPRLLQRWRRALCLSNQHRDTLNRMFQVLARAADWPDLTMAQRKRILADPGWAGAWRLLLAIDCGDAAPQIAQDAAPLLKEGVAPPPLAGGDDLIALGLKPGPVFKDLLDRVYDAQLENRVTTREEALVWLREHTD